MNRPSPATGATASFESHEVSHAGGERPSTADRWLSWLIGLAILGAVLFATLHVSDAKEFLLLFRRVKVEWLLIAALAQAVTYLSEAEVWRTVTRAAGHPVRLSTAYQLGIAKLFVDQAVPTGGLSGTLVYFEGLRRSGIGRRVAISGIVVDAFSYYFAYALCVAVALVIVAAQRTITAPIAALAVLFAIASTMFAVAVLMPFGWRAGPLRDALARHRRLAHLLGLLNEIDPALAHAPRVLTRAIAWQTTIQVLDAATLWLLLLALGVAADPAAIFASYMFSALFRTLSVSPGGLGTYEAASVLILRAAGVPIEPALAATLLFRVLNFWLPMAPGVWCARRVVRSRGPFSPERRAVSGAPSA